MGKMRQDGEINDTVGLLRTEPLIRDNCLRRQQSTASRSQTW